MTESKGPKEVKMELRSDTSDIGVSTILHARYWTKAHNASNFCSTQVHTQAPMKVLADGILKEFENLQQSFSEQQHIVIGVLDGQDVLIHCYSGRESYEIYVAGDDLDAGRKALERIKAELPEHEQDAKEDEVSVKFWTQGSVQGPTFTKRNIAADSWRDVQANYPTNIRGDLERMIGMETADNGAGKLILWHGPPGTGKTHCIRTLIRTWTPWCEANYVIDPEQFFGTAGYMMQVVMSQNASSGPDYWEFEDRPFRRRHERKEPKWNLLIIEDADEFLVADAKQRTGQGLARLLNLADGMVGQGLRTLILITTNEPLNNLHPAVARQGRCLANIDFGHFKVPEANEWLAVKGCDDRVNQDMSLAALYDLINKRQIKTDREEVTTSSGYL